MESKYFVIWNAKILNNSLITESSEITEGWMDERFTSLSHKCLIDKKVKTTVRQRHLVKMSEIFAQHKVCLTPVTRSQADDADKLESQPCDR